MAALDDALHQLRRHRGLLSVAEPTAEGDSTLVKIDVQVALPARARTRGASLTGVRAVEPCLLIFTKDWPLTAPTVLLREDFPLNLPHINPHKPGQLVSPCLFDGSLDEVLHRFGLDAIIDQLVDWLHKAAGGVLIDPAQGWEPMRRDRCPSTIVCGAEQALAAVPADGSTLVTDAFYLKMADQQWIHAVVNPAFAVKPDVVHAQGLAANDGSLLRGNAGVLVARSPRTVETYQPDTVVDMESLLSTAEGFGIDRSQMRSSIDDYYRRSVLDHRQDARTWSGGLFLIVILLVERPFDLIGSPGRRVEILPYVVRFIIAPTAQLEQHATVEPASHTHALSSQLLAATSGVSTPRRDKPLVILGCGSVGSKLAVHLGRSGIGGMTLIDQESFSPHNAARHALIPENPSLAGNKAELVKQALEKLSHPDCRAFSDDVVAVLRDPALFSQRVPENTLLIIDATASLKVLAAETTPGPLDQAEARLLRVVLFGQGRCGVLQLEGIDRTCRVDDISAALFQQCRVDPALRTQMAGDGTNPTRVFVGDNCRSLTARMSDARLSRASATLALQIERWLAAEIPTSAKLGLAIADSSNVGMSWSLSAIGPTNVLQVTEQGGWQIRVLHDVEQFIHADAQHWLPYETGGALVGRINYANRTITVAGTVPAPADSVRTAARFVLGTEGLVTALRQAHADSLGYLSFIGTWHSHPTGGPHSGIDRDTLSRIAADAGGLPAISLVWTPTGLTCAVDRW